jgi:hypothetical protein
VVELTCRGSLDFSQKYSSQPAERSMWHYLDCQLFVVGAQVKKEILNLTGKINEMIRLDVKK